jgi:membrane fusion protein (multidrug efflux system)
MARAKQNPTGTIVIALVLLAAVAGGIYWFIPAGEEAPQQPPAQEVTALTLVRKTADISEEFPGRTSAYAVSEVRPQVSGIIQKRLFTEGRRVSKGQQLYQIDPAPFQAAYNSAKATLAKAQASVKATQAKATRYKQLVKIEAISKQEFDDITASQAQAVADVGVAKAALDQAKINLDYTKVYAPIDGRISKSAVTQGALVDAQQTTPLATITQLHPIYVDITQPSEDMQRLRAELKNKTEQKVALLYQNGQPYAEKGDLQFTDITVDPTTSAVQMRALFDNPDADLLPGMFVRAKLELRRDNALLVPQKAATRNADGSLSVWVIAEDGTVNPATITTERSIKDQWLVISGVNAGDKIVLEGVQKVQPGAKVTIAKPPEEKTEAPAAAEGK